MKKRLKWHKKLRVSELKHLKECGITSLRVFQDVINAQQKLREKYPNHSEPCWDCRFIADKLNMDKVKNIWGLVTNDRSTEATGGPLRNTF